MWTWTQHKPHSLHPSSKLQSPGVLLYISPSPSPASVLSPGRVTSTTSGHHSPNGSAVDPQPLRDPEHSPHSTSWRDQTWFRWSDAIMQQLSTDLFSLRDDWTTSTLKCGNTLNSFPHFLWLTAKKKLARWLMQDNFCFHHTGAKHGTASRPSGWS